ncbi:hypothetical protein C4D60_Mb05t24900 [Musa balbisiana]|uniref:Uncharacterized protein n=1 Tax=Musa balbisiana TaxID=52838 RepID=A0A4V4H8F1_MUSBA|nr:hypothetical protein C4D60_Mb05t24900 [Musa balbisiana]
MVEISSDGTQSETSPAVTIPPVIGRDLVPSSTPRSHAPDEPPSQEEQKLIGRPWTTALFDCGDNQTNGFLLFFSRGSPVVSSHVFMRWISFRGC